jgi:hypothetical protein
VWQQQQWTACSGARCSPAPSSSSSSRRRSECAAAGLMQQLMQQLGWGPNNGGSDCCGAWIALLGGMCLAEYCVVWYATSQPCCSSVMGKVHSVWLCLTCIWVLTGTAATSVGDCMCATEGGYQDGGGCGPAVWKGSVKISQVPRCPRSCLLLF